MLLKVFSIRDQKAGVFNTPFFQKSVGEAERNFRELIKDDKSLVSKYPEDFDLYEIGDYDDEKGLVISLDTPHHIAKAVNLKM